MRKFFFYGDVVQVFIWKPEIHRNDSDQQQNVENPDSFNFITFLPTSENNDYDSIWRQCVWCRPQWRRNMLLIWTCHMLLYSFCIIWTFLFIQQMFCMNFFLSVSRNMESVCLSDGRVCFIQNKVWSVWKPSSSVDCCHHLTVAC